MHPARRRRWAPRLGHSQRDGLRRYRYRHRYRYRYRYRAAMVVVIKKAMRYL